MTWDFSKYGLTDGVKEAVVSAIKTIASFALSFILVKLVNFHVPAQITHTEVIAVLTIIWRGLISGFVQWVTTYAPADIMPAQPIDNPSGIQSV